jgi:hypothetical protein
MAQRKVFVDAGKRGARKRWGPPRIIRLDGLTPDQRRLVLAMVEMARTTDSDPAAA